MAPPWRIRYYKADDGSVPFRSFISGLTRIEERAECKAFIEFLKQRGDTIRGRYHLTRPNDEHELTGRFVHILYKIDSPNFIVIIINGHLPNQGGRVI
jgi:hypothetical protein